MQTTRQALNAMKTAKVSYQEHKGECLRLLAIIQTEIRQRNVNDPHWGHVGSMAHYESHLRELHDALTNQGEYARGGAQ